MLVLRVVSLGDENYQTVSGQQLHHRPPGMTPIIKDFEGKDQTNISAR